MKTWQTCLFAIKLRGYYLLCHSVQFVQVNKQCLLQNVIQEDTKDFNIDNQKKKTVRKSIGCFRF